MSTTLTKTMRAQILENVIGGTNLLQKRKEIEDETKSLARDWVIAQQPLEFTKFANDHPKEWFEVHSTLRVDASSNPLAPLRMDDTYYTTSIDFEQLGTVPTVNNWSWKADLTEAKAKFFAKQYKKAAAWREKYDETVTQINAVLNTYRTVEKLTEAVPEFEPHVPVKPAKAYPLVAPSTMLSMLTKLGFDMTQKEQAHGKEKTEA